MEGTRYVGGRPVIGVPVAKTVLLRGCSPGQFAPDNIRAGLFKSRHSAFVSRHVGPPAWREPLGSRAFGRRTRVKSPRSRRFNPQFPAKADF